MKLLVTLRSAPAASYVEERDAIARDWTALFNRFGVTPILVPNGIDQIAPYLGLGCRGLLLTGGDDVGTAASAPRDRTEARLIDAALGAALPVLGVCRGLQMLNVHFGGTLTASPGPHVAVDHAVRLVEPLAGRAAGARVTVNSFHNHAVRADGLAPGLIATAVADDGAVEALRHDRSPVWAIQWHPERPAPDQAFSDQHFQEWLNRCA